MSGVHWLTLPASALLAVMLLVATFNLATARRLERAAPPRRATRVSVLVPARNEAYTLPESLPGLLRLDPPPLEVLVLDDGSTDGTSAVVEALAEDHAPLRLLRGAPPPPGWLGKPWACHQLARAARGDVLVFCDADVFAQPGALRATLGLLEEADLVTVIPRQRFCGWAPCAVVPLVAQLPVLALLPLRLVEWSRSPSLAMGNGQWLAVRRDAYATAGGHAAVRGEVVEDVALARRGKAAGLRLIPAVSTALLAVRMYRDLGEVRAGFAKNLYPLLGGTPRGLALGMAVWLLCAVLPWAALPAAPGAALLPLALLLALRLEGALLFRHGWRSLALHPAGALCAAWIALESFTGHRRGTLRWKQRTLPTASPSPRPLPDAEPRPLNPVNPAD